MQWQDSARERGVFQQTARRLKPIDDIGFTFSEAPRTTFCEGSAPTQIHDALICLRRRGHSRDYFKAPRRFAASVRGHRCPDEPLLLQHGLQHLRSVLIALPLLGAKRVSRPSTQSNFVRTSGKCELCHLNRNFGSALYV